MTIPLRFPKNSQRIPKEFPKSSQRIPKEFPKNSQRIPKEFPKNCQIFLVAILSQLMFVTAFVPLNVDILLHELFKSLHRTWRTKSLSCLLVEMLMQKNSNVQSGKRIWPRGCKESVYG